MSLISVVPDWLAEFLSKALLIVVGAVATQITLYLLRSGKGRPACEDKQEIRKSLKHGDVTVAWNEYSDLLTERNRIAKRFNKLIDKYTDLQSDHAVFNKDAREQRDKHYLALCVLKAAVIFSLFSLIVTLVWNPSGKQAVSEVILPHMVGLAAAAILVSCYYTRRAVINTVIPKTTVAFTVGLIGIALSGIIALSIFLPYQWRTLTEDAWGITWVSKPYFIMLVRIGALPLVSALASLFVCLFIKRNPHNGTSAVSS